MAGSAICLSNGGRVSQTRLCGAASRKDKVLNEKWGRKESDSVPGLSAGFFGGMTEAKNGGPCSRPNQKEHLTRSRSRMYDHNQAMHRTCSLHNFSIEIFHFSIVN